MTFIKKGDTGRSASSELLLRQSCSQEKSASDYAAAWVVSGGNPSPLPRQAASARPSPSSRLPPSGSSASRRARCSSGLPWRRGCSPRDSPHRRSWQNSRSRGPVHRRSAPRSFNLSGVIVEPAGDCRPIALRGPASSFLFRRRMTFRGRSLRAGIRQRLDGSSRMFQESPLRTKCRFSILIDCPPAVIRS